DVCSSDLCLEHKLGAVLWQFPPSFRFDPEQFAHFLELLPQDGEAARACARGCDAGMKRKGSFAFGRDGPLRHAVEIRNRGFVDPAFVELLARHRVPLVVADTAGQWPYSADVTADCGYLPLHGHEELYASGYSADALDRWAERIRAWSRSDQPDDAHMIDPQRRIALRKRNAYCDVDYDIKVAAPCDARSVMERLGLAE